jgi:hypothetical protein
MTYSYHPHARSELNDAADYYDNIDREVERLLRVKRSDHDLPVVYVKHPSYYYKKERESSILQGIKSEIQRHL